MITIAIPAWVFYTLLGLYSLHILIKIAGVLIEEENRKLRLRIEKIMGDYVELRKKEMADGK